MQGPIWNFISQIALGQIRHFATAIFAMLATRGYLVGNDIDTATGAVMVLVTLLFSAYDKYRQHKTTVQPVATIPSPSATETQSSGVYGS